MSIRINIPALRNMSVDEAVPVLTPADESLIESCKFAANMFDNQGFYTEAGDAATLCNLHGEGIWSLRVDEGLDVQDWVDDEGFRRVRVNTLDLVRALGY